MPVDTITLLEKSLILTVVLSAPLLIVAVVIGILLALLQTLTQIQDQTLPFAVKLVAVAFAMAATGVWMGSELITFTNLVFDNIPNVGR